MPIQIQDLLLYRRVVIHSRHSPGMLSFILSKSIVSKRFPAKYELLSPYGPMDYEGKVSQTGFRLHRIIGNRNSFLPFLYGKFKSSPHGTRIETYIVINPVAAVFILTVTIISTVLLLRGWIISGDFWGSINGMWIMVLIVYLLGLATFIDESRIAVRFLSDLFQETKE
jgi:hypothetical protein